MRPWATCSAERYYTSYDHDTEEHTRLSHVFQRRDLVLQIDRLITGSIKLSRVAVDRSSDNA